MGMLRQYMEEQAAAKHMTISGWIQARIKEIPSCRLATHVGKFSHPDAKVTVYDTTSALQNGYVCTANSEHKADISVNAAYMSTAKLLLGQPLEDGHTVFWHIVSGSNDVEAEFQAAGIDSDVYHAFKSSVLQCSQAADADATDDRLKQVYFPVSCTAYHLLTVLPASSLLMALKEKVEHMENVRHQCRDKDSEYYGTTYQELLNLTEISYGGTKPQNISYLNNTNGGTAYVLPSLPPMLRGRRIRLPKKMVFRECIPIASCAPIFKQLHRLFKEPRNSIDIREAIKWQVQNLIELAMDASYAIRSTAAGWSDNEAFASLPLPQKIWLDAQYGQERRNDEWRDELSTDFGRWVIYTYELILKQERYILGDEELKFFKYEFKAVLDEVVRYEC